MNKRLIIDIWADITCPFCYIGETLLKRELEQWEHADSVHVEWRSALLMPELPLEESFTWSQSMADVDDPERLAMINKKMSVLRHLSEKYGLQYNLEHAFSHNSQRAARLLKLASRQGLALELATLFGKGYFSEAKDYSKPDELRATALQIGLPAHQVEEVLNGDLMLAEVREDQVLGIKYAPNYVPTIYFNREGRIEGVLKPEQIKNSLEEAWLKL